MNIINKSKYKKHILIIIFLLLIIIGYFTFFNSSSSIVFNDNLQLEINTEFNYKSIIKTVKDGNMDEIVADTSKLKNDKIGSYPIIYKYKDDQYTIKIEVIDKNKPIFDINNIEIDAGMKVKPEALVTNIKDETKTKVSFDKKYDFSKQGKVNVIVNVIDESKNVTSKKANVTVLSKDSKKPEITGLNDLSVTVNGKIDYNAGVNVEDNRDPQPKLMIDHKKVDLTKTGDYSVIYTCVDRSGNKTVKKRKITVLENKEIGVYKQTDDKIIYMTFDDGPSSNTKKILDILDNYNAKATFFVTGANPTYYHLIKDAYNRGHTIGLHTFSHDYKTVYSSAEGYFNDLDKIGAVVKEQIGFIPKYIRFPGGASNSVSKKYCAGIMSFLTKEVISRNYQYYDWNSGTGDAAKNNVPVEQIFASATAYNANNQVILAHDTDAKDTTVEALSSIIEHYQRLGYVFKGIDDNSYVPHHHVNN